MSERRPSAEHEHEHIDVIVVGSGNAALCAAIAAAERGARVHIVEKAPPAMAGGNTKYTAGAMRFAYEGREDLLPLLLDPGDPRLARSDFGRYTAAICRRPALFQQRPAAEQGTEHPGR